MKIFYKTDPPQSGHFSFDYNFEIFKTKILTQKRPPKAFGNNIGQLEAQFRTI